MSQEDKRKRKSDKPAQRDVEPAASADAATESASPGEGEAEAAGPEASEATEAPLSAGQTAERDTAEEEPLQSQLLRLRADFDNYRKRMQREREDVSRRSLESLMQELLPVLDHFELGLATAAKHQTDPAVMDGFELVYTQMMSALEKFGLTPIDAEGQAFDPHLHEAATHMPSDEHPEDIVIAQTRRGYKLGEKLLRPAQVVVSKGPVRENEGSHSASGADGS